MSQYDTVFSVNIPYSLVGNGAVENVASVVKRFGAKKVLIVTDEGIVKAGLVDRVKKPLSAEGIECGIFDGCKPDSPLGVIKNCGQVAKEGGYDMIIAIGGGSVMDTAKLVSIVATAANPSQENMQSYFAGIERPGLPKIMIPTTAGTGSEWTYISVTTDESVGEKKTVRSEYLLPEATIIDPLLTLDLPARVTAETGMDALSHAIESYTSVGSNQFFEMFEETAIKLIATSLRAAYGKVSQNKEARYDMAIAATMACMPCMFTGLGLVHGMGHSLQMKAHCSHGVSCSLMLPYVMEYNLPVCIPKYARIAELMGETVEDLSPRGAAQEAISAVRQLSLDLGMPQRLRDTGIKKDDIPGFVDFLFTQQVRMIVANPRDCSRDDAKRIYEAAW